MFLLSTPVRQAGDFLFSKEILKRGLFYFCSSIILLIDLIFLLGGEAMKMTIAFMALVAALVLEIIFK